MGLAYSPGHALVGATWVMNHPPYYAASGLDLVDIGGSGANRWVVQWVSNGPPISSHHIMWYAIYDATFSGLWSSATPVWPPAEPYEQQRWSSAVGLMPSSRRIVHVGSQFQHHPPNACTLSAHNEWRALLALRESSTGAVVPGKAKFYASNMCSYHPLHQGQQGWGQELPHVATSWFLSDWFVVTWYDRDQHHCGVYARVFDANGAPVTGDILVDEPVANCFQPLQGDPPVHTMWMTSPRVAASGLGFMVAWGRPDGQVMMRSFLVNGTPLIPARPVALGPLEQAQNPDITVAVANLCGDYQTYFAVSWWSRIAAAGPWTPQMMVYQNLTDPTPIIPGAGWLNLDAMSQVQNDGLLDRVSIDFFNKANVNDSACDDLTLGASWTMREGPTKKVDLIRRRVIQFQPYCPLGAPQGEGDALGPAAGGLSLGCEPPECFVVHPQPPPPAEPSPILFVE